MFAQTTSVLFALSILGFTSTSAAPTSASAGLEARASYDGTATYYYQGGNPGSCGDYHSGKSSQVSEHASVASLRTCCAFSFKLSEMTPEEKKEYELT